MTYKELVIPDYLKEMMVSSEQDASNLIGGMSSVPRLSLRGKKFRFIEAGDEVHAQHDPINVIILGVSPPTPRLMSKTFYIEKYNPDDTAPPDCSSLDGIHPDTWVNTPQANTCAVCPKNKWGSATSEMTGKKTKACKDSKRLYVLRVDKGIDIKEDTIYILTVTVSSLKYISEYGKFLSEHKLPMAAVITKVTMDDDSDYPKISFDLAGIMKEVQGKTSMERAGKQEWVEMQQLDGPAPRPQLTGPNTNEGLADNSVVSEPVNTKVIVEQSTNEVSTNEPVEEAHQGNPSDIDDILGSW